MGNAENPSKVLASSISIERDEEDKDQEPSLLPSTISAKKINYRTACHIDCNKDETNFRALSASCSFLVFSLLLLARNETQCYNSGA